MYRMTFVAIGFHCFAFIQSKHFKEYICSLWYISITIEHVLSIPTCKTNHTLETKTDPTVSKKWKQKCFSNLQDSL